MRIGLIQTQRLGDLMIALPIAFWFAAQGHEVHWPVSDIYVDIMRKAAPGIDFIPVQSEGLDSTDFFYHTPRRQLDEVGCERIICLYAYLRNSNAPNKALAAALKFDEYKYAISSVPFARKWTLGEGLVRDMAREQALFDRLAIDGPYICVHRIGSLMAIEDPVPAEWRTQFRVIEVEELTDNPLDWLLVLERASRRMMIDSVFANLVDQLAMPGENFLMLRSDISLTPVYRNDWVFCVAAPASAAA